MKARDELQAAATAFGQDRAEAAFGPPVHVRTEAASEGWHGTLNRRIYEQRMSIWKSYALIDVIVGAGGQVAGFVDHEAYRRSDDGSVMSDAELLGLVADQELLPAYSEVVAGDIYPGPDGGRIVALTVEARGSAGRPRRWLVEINPARRLIAAIRPLDEDAAAVASGGAP